MDSLQVSIVRSGANALLNQFGKSFKATLSDIYTWPSVAGITQQLLSFEAGATDTPSSDISSDVRSIIERYGVIGPRSAPASKETVVLTGSSGSLGVFLLHELLRKPEVEVIYCFSRSHTDATALQRHQSAFRLKGLDCGELADPRINFLYVDLSRADLGLDHEVYDKVSACARSVQIREHGLMYSPDPRLGYSHYPLCMAAGLQHGLTQLRVAAHCRRPPFSRLSDEISKDDMSSLSFHLFHCCLSQMGARLRDPGGVCRSSPAA